MKLLLTSIFLSTFLADRLSKFVALKALAVGPVQVFDMLNFELLWNRGVSWSLFATDSATGFWLLTMAIVATFIIFLGYTLWRFLNNFSIEPEVLIAAGALSNLCDRFWYGAVIDFIDLHLEQYHFATFNIADAAIVLGVGCMLIRMWSGPRERTF